MECCEKFYYASSILFMRPQTKRDTYKNRFELWDKRDFASLINRFLEAAEAAKVKHFAEQTSTTKDLAEAVMKRLSMGEWHLAQRLIDNDGVANPHDDEVIADIRRRLGKERKKTSQDLSPFAKARNLTAPLSTSTNPTAALSASRGRAPMVSPTNSSSAAPDASTITSSRQGTWKLTCSSLRGT